MSSLILPVSDPWRVAPSRPVSPQCRSRRSHDRDGVSSQGGISTSRAFVCQQLSLAWISICIQLRTFIPVESSSAWHWGPAVLLRAQWFMYCWVRAAGSSQRSPGRVACRICLCVCVCLDVCMKKWVWITVALCKHKCVWMSEKLHEGQRRAPGRVPLSIWLGEAPFVWLRACLEEFSCCKNNDRLCEAESSVYKLCWLAEEEHWRMSFFDDGLTLDIWIFFSCSF